MASGDMSDMRGVPIPFNERDRLAALQSCKILDTPVEPAFDRLTALAGSVFNVPISLVSLVDKDRQWFKSAFGLEVKQTERSSSFCAHAIVDDPVMVVADTREDPRFSENPLVTGEPYIRFYAGAPLTTYGGFRLGTLCIIDTKPRPEGLSKRELKVLRDLAGVAMHEIEAGRQASQEFTNLRKQLQHADAAKQRFLHMMSHELRTPLNAIIGFSEVLEQRSASAGLTDDRDYAAHIGDAGRHLLNLLNGVLEWSRVGRGEIRIDERDVALSEPIDTVLAMLPECKDRLTLDPRLGSLRLKCDPRFVAQVLANIVENALKYCDENTPIDLSVEWSEGEPFLIRVADQGPGIPEQRLQDALNVFEQLGDQFSRQDDGLGLGLAISRKLMELHGGELKLQTSLGSGTTVEMIFPAYRGSAGPG